MNSEFNILKNKSLISCRPHSYNSELESLAKPLGLNVISLPLIELNEIHSKGIDDKIKNIRLFSHIVFTSRFAFECFIKKTEKLEVDIPKHIGIFTIGYNTFKLVNSRGFSPINNNKIANAKELIAEINKITTNANILWPTSSIARNNFEGKLNTNIDICKLNIYENIIPKNIDKELINKINETNIVFIASPSAVNNLSKLSKERNMLLCCIGERSANEAKNRAYANVICCTEPTSKNLLITLSKYLNNTQTCNFQ